VQRAELASARASLVGHVGLGQRALGVEPEQRVQLAVVAFDPLELVLQQLTAGNAPLTERGQQLRGRQQCRFDHSVRAPRVASPVQVRP
jgi:hypothetical protein